MENETRYTRICPNCGNRLGFSSNQSSIHCQCCDSDFSAEELIGSQSRSNILSGTFAQENIDTCESGLAYLDSVFGTLDWDDFCTNNPSLFVESVSAVVDKMKVKFANQASTWLFEFKSMAIPLQKRFEFMEKTLEKIAGKDVDLEDEETLSKFDCYSLSAELIAKKKSYINKALEIDINFMKQFKLDATNLKKAQDDIASIQKTLEGIRQVNSIYELEVVQEKIKEKEKIILNEYKKQGINAPEVYERAIKNYLFGNKSEALVDFESIREYRDVNKYIRKLKIVTFPFNAKFVEFAGANYLYCPNSPDKVDPEKKSGCSSAKQAVPANSITNNFVNAKLSEFRPIVDGLRGPNPALKKIERIIMAYGDVLYYINDENKLVAYDFSKKTMTALVSLKGCKISEDSLFRYPNLGKFIFLAPVPKKEIEQPSGCSGKNKNSAQPATDPAAPVIAEYRLAIVDTYNCSLSYYGEGILSITDTFGEKIFYTKNNKDVVNNTTFRTYHVFDVKEGKALCPFKREVFIYNVIDNYIIYGLWQPNENNIDIYSYNLDTTEIILLEKNAYDIATINRFGKRVPLSIDGYVYYTVGNREFSPLYRVKPDGSDKKEIMPNVENINFVRNGYFYITKVSPFLVNGKWCFDRTLVKTKADGSSTSYVCSGFSRIIQFKQGYIYYVDDDDASLHIVRADGEQDRIISEHFERELLINEKNIFFLYKEKVSSGREGKSIYVMDLQGKNLHKVAFDVVSAEYCDDNNIYYCTDDIISYSVQTPKDLKSYNKPVTRDYKVRMYYSLNVNDLNLTRIYIENAPTFDKGGQQVGCRLFKKKTLPTIATQVEHIYPMPIKTKISFVQSMEEENKKPSINGIAGNLVKNGAANPGCGCGGKAKKK